MAYGPENKDTPTIIWWIIGVAIALALIAAAVH